MTAKRKSSGWGVFNVHTGRMLLFDGRMPLYWLRRVAVDAATKRGFMAGKDFVVQRVYVEPANG